MMPKIILTKLIIKVNGGIYERPFINILTWKKCMKDKKKDLFLFKDYI